MPCALLDNVMLKVYIATPDHYCNRRARLQNRRSRERLKRMPQSPASSAASPPLSISSPVGHPSDFAAVRQIAASDYHVGDAGLARFPDPLLPYFIPTQLVAQRAYRKEEIVYVDYFSQFKGAAAPPVRQQRTVSGGAALTDTASRGKGVALSPRARDAFARTRAAAREKRHRSKGGTQKKKRRRRSGAEAGDGERPPAKSMGAALQSNRVSSHGIAGRASTGPATGSAWVTGPLPLARMGVPRNPTVIVPIVPGRRSGVGDVASSGRAMYARGSVSDADLINGNETGSAAPRQSSRRAADDALHHGAFGFDLSGDDARIFAGSMLHVPRATSPRLGGERWDD